VLLDLDPSIGLGRVADRGAGVDRLEAESLPFHERVRYAFLDLASAEPGRYLVLDANRPSDTVAEMVADRVAMLLPEAMRTGAAAQGPDGGPPHGGEQDSEPALDLPEATRLLEGPLSTVESRSTVQSNRP